MEKGKNTLGSKKIQSKIVRISLRNQLISKNEIEENIENKNNEKINDLVYTQALKLDNRRIFQYFYSLIYSLEMVWI